MARSRQKSRLPRNLAIAVVVLVVLYALAGFLLLPWWLKSAVPEQLDQQMGWQAQVTDLAINPFALTVEATELSANDRDGEKVLGFDRLFVNLSFFQLFRGIVGFQEIRLQEPYIRVDLLEDYGINFARDWQVAHPEPQPAAEPETSGEDSGPPKLFFQQLAIDGGELLFRDFSQAEPAEFRITPLDLSLNDLATWPREEGDSNYYLLAAIGSQTVEWQGDLSVTPLYSRGTLRIADISYETLEHFLAPYLPYDLRGGNVTVRSDYELQAGEVFYLATENGELSLEDLAVALDAESEASRLTTGRIGVDQIGFDLTAREARVGQVTVDNLDLAVARDAGGSIDWLAPLAGDTAGAEADESAPESAADTRPFRWSVDGIRVARSAVRWQDRVPASEADLRLQEISLSTGNVSHRLEEPVSYDLSATLASGGRLALQGQVTPAPFTFEAAVSGSGITLAAFEPYLQQGANLSVANGQLGFDGNLDLDSQQEPMTGTFSGTAEVSNLNLRLAGQQDRLMSWQTVRLAPIEYNVSPARLEIGTISVVQPVANIVRGTDAVHNVERIPVSGGGAASDPGSDEAADSGNGQPSLIFRIGELAIENGSVAYTDRTLSPAFTTSFDDLSGSVIGISNIPPQQGKVSLKGRVGQVGNVNFQGTLGTLGTDDVSDLTLAMDNLSLPELSPYFGRYLGYGVDSGKLNLDLDYEIAGSRIDASNLVVMDRLQLGQAVASDEAVNAPVKLGLALLQDRKGIIEVDLPISGDLSDPDFSVGQVVMRAFVNLLVKAAASPFSMLGSIAEMAGLTGEDLGQVSFVPGSVELAEGEAAKLSALADALRERPELLLNVRGAVSPETDGLALLRDELTNGGQKELSEEAWASAREAYLSGERTLSPEALNNLARDRGLAVRRLLTDTQEVPGNQLFLLDPARDAQVGAEGNVVVPFTLDVR
ncbi:DUF748 domain-containing protein [Marinobacter pelagius]|uniref:Uncharacterized protein involved in outer membrane biogenesis n=1 Tax=Marinobacter pelagius TaxID=379482 RepID=A0A1I4RYJ7_9GAMM|nr:DUF748 domain-containing protein [Marinobacter pelagius]SFM57074.1 Uncharacterized protein involved in outer membrane biogenesis [Marinobacter pelagius]